MTFAELLDENSLHDSLRESMTLARNGLIHTVGNLTVLSQALNSAISNAAWSQKKPEMLKNSLLPINQNLYHHDNWDEVAIVKRSEELFDKAMKIWPR